MSDSLPILLIVAIICLVIGVLIGVLLSSLRGEREDTSRKQTDEAPPGGEKGRYTSVVRLWRDQTQGDLIVEMDGKAYRAIEPLDDSQRERLLQVSRDLVKWQGFANQPRQPQAATTATDVNQHRTATAVPTPTPHPSTPVMTNVNSPASASAHSSTPSNSLPNQLSAQKPKEQPSSIVGQIDLILQEMLEGTPLLSKGVHLYEDPRKGVVVWIGLDHYEGIDNVPDPEIKGLIRGAVAEWERRK